MPKTELGYKHTIHLEAVTPVAVGDGGTLSPSADYTVNPQNKKEVLLLDHKKFEVWLDKNPAILTDYLKEVHENTGKNRNKFLHQFISKYHQQSEVASFFKAKRTVVGYDNTVELKTCIKDAGRPYIPGSTIKGAFKSVWLHNWLDVNKAKVDEIVWIIGRSRGEKDARKKIDDILNECLDNSPCQNERMHFSALQVSDAYCTGMINWYHTKRFKLLKDDNTIVPLFIEAVAPTSGGTFTLMVENNKSVRSKHQCIQTLEANSLVPFYTQVNRYTLDHINHELEMTKSDKLWDYQQFLRNLKDDINASKNQSAWLPIGFGKSNFYQSIGLFIRNSDKDVFEKYIKLFRIGKRPKHGETDQKELPLTRNLTTEGHSPLGWIRIFNQEAAAVDKFNQDDLIEATVENIHRPFSKIKVPGVDGLIEMTGTKFAQKNPRFKEQSVVIVRIDLNKERKISRARFIRVK